MKRILLAVCVAVPLFAEVKQLSLTQALEMLKKENLELKIAKFDARMKALEAKAV